jgi:UDP-2,3-diacylglucosamine pyrophosphatase LpxH
MNYADRRQVDLVVISDVHLGTYGCHAHELVRYLKSIAPRTLVLNGDIIDIWQFSKKYFPASHMAVIKEFTRMMSHGAKIHYIPGNHDEMLRRFVGQELGNLTIDNKAVIELDGKKAWIFHGDVFDVTMKHSRWVAKLGGKGYDMLIILNRMVNYILMKLGRGKISLSKRIKDSVKAAVKFISDFEATATQIGISKGYDFVICGHIHQPAIRKVENSEGSILYLNSGDWVENLTGLEYHKGDWRLYHYASDPSLHSGPEPTEDRSEWTTREIFMELTREFEALRA